MNCIQTKICGITRVADAVAALEAGAEAIGLNFYAKSKRFVSVADAKAIAESVQGQMAIVGVFVNASVEQICEVASAVGLSHVQLHGDEQPGILESLRGRLPDTKFIRAIRVREDDLRTAQLEIDDWQISGVNLVLLDAASLEGFGGTGTQLDWQQLEKLELTVPWLLAGGLTPQNVGNAISLCYPDGVDVASGVETEPGIKSNRLSAEFVSNANTELSNNARKNR